MNLANRPSPEVHTAVHSTYSTIAQSEIKRQDEFGDGGAQAKAIAMAFGYPSLDLDSLPDGANLGLSCGHPVGVASIQPVSPSDEYWLSVFHLYASLGRNRRGS
jgi:hypothetical protein